MAVLQFLNLDMFKGNSEHPRHKGEFDVVSWSFGEFDREGPEPSTGVAGHQQPTAARFTFVMSDRMPALLLACNAGTHIREGSISVEKYRDGKLRDSLRWTMKDLRIENMSPTGSPHQFVIVTLKWTKLLQM
jgi:type VI protein secretion system component Hcp